MERRKPTWVKNTLKTALSLVLGLVVLWMLYRKTDFGELWAIIKSANLGFILFSLVFGLIGNILRALRWELLINSLGYRPKRMSIIYATLGNYAVNFVLPRAGDVWRCAMVNRYDKIPFPKVLETFLVDKVIEIVSGLAIVFISVLVYVDLFSSYFQNNVRLGESVSSLFGSFWPYLAMAVGAIAIVLLFTVFRNTFVAKKIRDFFDSVKRDLKLIAGMKERKRVIIYTILVWVAFYLYFYVCFFAFPFTKGLGPLAGLFVFSMANIGVSVPVQGGIGTWHFAVIASLMLFGVADAEASAFAGAVFAVQSVWIIVCGIAAILMLPTVKRQNELGV